MLDPYDNPRSRPDPPRTFADWAHTVGTIVLLGSLYVAGALLALTALAWIIQSTGIAAFQALAVGTAVLVVLASVVGRRVWGSS